MSNKNLLNTTVYIYNKDSTAAHSRLHRVHDIDDMCVTIYSNYQFVVRLSAAKMIDENQELHHIPKLYSVYGSEVKSISYGDNNQLPKNSVYTIYIPENMSYVCIDISFDGVDYVTYRINRVDNNVINEANAHYIDEITNHNLPTIEELLGAVEPSTSFDTREILKRLLLDINHIRSNKGTQDSLEKVFAFLGYNSMGKQIFFMPEYRKPDGMLTISPNTYQDVRTGEYYVLYRLYEFLDNKTTLDEDLLPEYKTTIFGSKDLHEHLLNAIALINKYFCIKEQHIKLIDEEMMCNNPLYDAVGSLNNITFHYDNQYFYEKLKFRVYHLTETVGQILNDTQDGAHRRYITNQHNISIPYREVKYRYIPHDDHIIHKPGTYNDVAYKFCIKEYVENEVIDYIHNFETYNGNILHVEFSAPGAGYTYSCIVVSSEDDVTDDKPYAGDDYPKHCLSSGIVSMAAENHVRIALLLPKKYRILFNVRDPYGSTFSYIQDINLGDSAKIFSRLKICNTSNCSQNNGMILEPSTTYSDIVANSVDIGGTGFPLRQLMLVSVPSMLGTYFTQTTGDIRTHYMGEVRNMTLDSPVDDPIMTVQLKDMTTTLPMDLMYQWVEVAEVMTPVSEILDVGVDIADNVYSIKDAPQYVRESVYVNVLKITDVDTGIETDTYILMSMIPGFNLDTYRWMLKNNFGEWKPVYDSLCVSKVPMFYDGLVDVTDNGRLRVSPRHEVEFKDSTGVDVKVPIIHNTYTYLACRDHNPNYSSVVKLNDVVICYVDPRYVRSVTGNHTAYDDYGVVWEIRDHFTGMLYHRSNDFSVKFRVKHKTSYDVYYKFSMYNYFGNDYKVGVDAVERIERSAFICS